MKKLAGSILLMVVAAAIAGTGFAALVATATPAEAGRCICPMIDAPVICDKGRIFPNQCFADCRNAKNCVPYGSLL